MGGRVHLPLALSAAALLAGCIDFTEPRLPNSGAPALMNLSVGLQENGVLSVSGQVQPGRDSSGVTRVPQDSSVFVADLEIPADTVLVRNTLRFSETLVVPRSALMGPIAIKAPPIAGILAPPPIVIWYGIRKLGSDTVVVAPGGDAVLVMDARLGEAFPPVQSRQWFLDLSGPGGVIRVSGNGYPPDTMRVPPQWLPATPPGTVNASLLYYQSGQVREPPGDYVGNFSMDMRIQWLVRLLPPTP